MNLFIDTNIFLSFYHFSSDDLEELNKLSVLVREEEVSLLLPEQVVTEFWRNRANKISDALERLQRQQLSLQFPQLCKEYEEYEKLRECCKEYQENYAKLVEKLRGDIDAQSLKADSTIEQLFGLATRVPTTEEILEAARLRCEIGNPPGKAGSLGDAINWEALLEAVDIGSELYFISDDKDYCSPLDHNKLDPFLLDEWQTTNESQLFFYRRLSGFFREKFPDIKFASELEKDLLIRELADSSSFEETHVVVGKLAMQSMSSDFSPAQVNDIVSAAVTNNQVYWIIGDSDVNTFLRNVIRGREDEIDPDNLFVLQELLPEEIDEEIPF